MKRLLFTLLGVVACVLAAAQTRTYSDNASGTFIFGLDSYFYGRTGSLEFEANGQQFQVTVDNGDVYVNENALEGGRGEVVVGIHDFTGNRIPELVVARRNNSWVALSLYRLSGKDWIPAASIDPVDGKEMRVFRQVVSVRNGDQLHSWTWHGDRFDYKSNR
jgi:hypothetical protein